jgi:hypothetical protein
LHRRIIAKQGSANPRIVILSDGLASPCSGEHSSDAMLRLRRAMEKLASNGNPVAWLAPIPKRGLKRWMTQLLHGLAVSHFEI